MNVASRPPQGKLTQATPSNRAHLSRLARGGAAIRLAPGIYAVGATLPPENVASLHRNAIIARIWPDAVVRGRSALAGGQPVNGVIYIAHPNPPRKTPLNLPGLVIVPETGPQALPGDMPLPDGIALAGQARTLVENIDIQGRPPRSRAGTLAVEDQIDTLARRGGPGRIQRVLAELDVIAGSFDPRQIAAVRERLVAVLGTVTSTPRSERLAARVAGAPYDAHIIERLEAVLDVVSRLAPQPRAATGTPERWTWLPFFEAYFSNFIEGTEFGVDEARRIAVEGWVPPARPADAHDVAATYRLTSDTVDRRRVPANSDELLELLRVRHEVLMAARPNKRPGMFKEEANYAGGYRFVDPDLVEGTLRRGFNRMSATIDPMSRAVGMMVLITECHPFDDGNGRIARLMANAELDVAGQVRVVISTSFRNNYLASLTALSSGNGDGQSLHAVMDFAQKWVSLVDWTTFERANEQLHDTYAYLDPAEAEGSGRRLRLPT
jgi:hypothetical protein